jgi:cephalosporin hydroxylase
MLAMIDYCEAVERRELLDPQATRRRVLGVDIDIRPHNRSAIAAHPMSHRIDMIQGSSIAPDIIQQVREIAGRHERVLVCLDSNHTHAHVLAELEAYAPLTSQGSYCCVFDTVIEDLPRDMYPERPWTVGDNPKTAVEEYLRTIALEGRASLDGSSLKFTVDDELQRKLLVTAAPSGYLKRI